MDPQVKVTFQAIVLRYVHDVMTGGCINIGVVLVCGARRYAGAAFAQSFARVTGAFPTASPVLLRRVRDAVVNACAAWPPDGELFPANNDAVAVVRSAFPDEAGVAMSPPIGGLTGDPERTLRELCDRYVERHVSIGEVASRNDEDVWRAFTARVSEPTVLRKLRARPLFSPEFQSVRLDLDHAWKNGTWHAAYPHSLDLSQPRVIVSKTMALISSIETVRPREQDTEVAVLVGMPGNGASEEARRAAVDGLALLQKRLRAHATVLTESQGDELAERMVHDLTHDHDAE
jgi:hypothetical protein